MSGLSKRPMQVSSVASRCLCCICGKRPRIRADGTDLITITANCCGKTESRIVEKAELVFTQRFFENGEGDDIDAGDTVDLS